MVYANPRRARVAYGHVQEACYTQAASGAMPALAEGPVSPWTSPEEPPLAQPGLFQKPCYQRGNGEPTVDAA